MAKKCFQALRDSPLARRITRYALGSVVALITSVVVFAMLLSLGVGTTVDSVCAFVAGAIPNWVLNRRWAWRRSGRVNVGREVVGYAAISVLSLLAASAATGWTHHAVLRVTSHGVAVAVVTAAYVAVQALLFGLKFLAYDRWVFTGRSRLRAALRSRHQVWSAARANRTP